MMKIKVQYKEKYLTLGYVSITKNTIVVWYTPQAIVGSLVAGNMLDLDLHATYPMNGDFHYSYKFMNSDDNLDYDKKIYHDRIVIIKYLNGEFVDKIRSERDGSDFLEHMVPDTMCDPLDNPEFNMFVYPQGAISMVKKTLSMITEESKPKDSDIILKVDGLEDSILNFGFSIYNKSREKLYQHGEVKRILCFENVYVEAFLRAVKTPG